jgi:hypothetical protein
MLLSELTGRCPKPPPHLATIVSIAGAEAHCHAAMHRPADSAALLGLSNAAN